MEAARTGTLNGKAAIVTGAASGIGFSIAQDLARRGARVFIVDVNDPAGSVSQLRTEGFEAAGLKGDVTSEQDIAAAVDECMRTFGRIDILVNNAGIFTSLTLQPFGSIPTDEWRRVLDVNVTGPYLFARAARPALAQSGNGRIINITSGTIFSAPAGLLHYVTSKGALMAMTRSLARELGPEKITVNAVAPGFMLSAGVYEHRTKDHLETATARARSARALQRDQEPQDIVGAVAFFAGDDSAFITGQTLVVDGGAVFN